MRKENRMPNPVVHFEILGKDHETLQKYYSDLFGWKITNVSPDFPYGIVGADEQGKGIGGGVGGVMPGGNAQLTIYVEVEDIQASLDRAGELGGETIVPVTTIPGMVIFAQFRDPEGNIVGLVSSEVPPAT